METSFFSGSENLYKYLVTMGILMVSLTVYYPLKEKQLLEISSIQLEKDIESINYRITENFKNAKNLQSSIAKNGPSEKTTLLSLEIEKLHNENKLFQIEARSKQDELIVRAKHIESFEIISYITIPVGFLLILFGFISWIIIKRTDDKILRLERDKLELEVKKLRKDEGYS